MYKSLPKLFAKIDAARAELAAFRPFAGDSLKAVADFHRTQVVQGSNSIEGFTYTIDETEALLKNGVTVRGKSAFEAFAVLGHARAYEKIFDFVRRDEEISVSLICGLHACLDGSLSNDSEAGKFRTFDVGSSLANGGRHVYPGPERLAGLMDSLFAWRERAQEILHPLRLTASFHQKLEAVHPFGDGNGRVGRLILNFDLVRNGMLPVPFGRGKRNEYVECLRERKDEAITRFTADLELQSMDSFLSFLKDHPQIQENPSSPGM